MSVRSITQLKYTYIRIYACMYGCIYLLILCIRINDQRYIVSYMLCVRTCRCLRLCVLMFPYVHHQSTLLSFVFDFFHFTPEHFQSFMIIPFLFVIQTVRLRPMPSVMRLARTVQRHYGSKKSAQQHVACRSNSPTHRQA